MPSTLMQIWRYACVLLAVGLAGHVAGRNFRGVVARVAPLIMAANAGVLGYMAWRMVA